MSQIDAIVIGTGFAGAVTACRLVQAGLRICVLERGRRYEADDFPVYPADGLGDTDVDGQSAAPSPSFSRWRWGSDHGLWDVRKLDQVIAVQAAGYGGGSLVYANVHLRAPPPVFDTNWPPRPYRRGPEGLDPYYNLAAYMLDVQPLPDRHPLAKSAQLQRAAHELNRRNNGEANGNGDVVSWFKPPLAVNFGEQDSPRFIRNRHKRTQGTCQLIGDCWRGCPIQAKNTLDLNYLAEVEDARDCSDNPLADIRTLAEVTSIKYTVPDTGKEPYYTVEYTDHLLNETGKTVQAGYVFLCAGAVNTTELLLRDSEKGNLPTARRDLIGKRYHLNADSLAAVFDCDEPHRADRGPTITGALLYDATAGEGQRQGAATDGKDGPVWFLIEDGGFPEDMEPLLGIFRSPLWMRRNRYIESPATRARQRGRYRRLPPGFAREIVSGVSARILTTQGRRPKDAVTDGWQVPGSLRETAADNGREDQDGLEPAGFDLWPVLPDWLARALEDDRDQLLEYLGWLAESMINELLDQVDRRITRELDIEALVASFKLTSFDPDDVQRLSRGLLRLATQVIWGSEADMARHAAEVLLNRLVPGGTQDFVQLLSKLLVWALDYRTGDGYTGLLLTMGRDTVSYRLGLEPGRRGKGAPRLWARWDPQPDAGAPVTIQPITKQQILDDIEQAWQDDLPPDQLWPFLSSQLAKYGPHVSTDADAPASAERTKQQQILRDIAKAWQGELRTDPIEPFMQRRLTVHGQGGCPLAEDEDSGVTAPDGRVFGCPGLFVMDAAAFPTPVGVNPSATILAVAEYKIEQFIKTHVKDESWRAKEFEKSQQWANDQLDKLDPIAALNTKQSKAPKSRPVGLKFSEWMEGFHSDMTEEMRRKFVGRQKHLQGSQPDYRHTIAVFREADLEGADSYRTINTALHAEIDDLTEYMNSHPAHQTGTAGPGALNSVGSAGPQPATPKIKLTGTIAISGWPEPGDPQWETDLEDGSALWLFAEHGGTTTFNYQLNFKHEGRPYYLYGFKHIHDDPGLDVWKDTTTLYFGLFEVKNSDDQNQDKLLNLGILRVPASKFFKEQLKSIEVTGTQDPARQSWTLGAFAQFFFGRLVDVYVPEIDEVVNVVNNIVTRTHD